MAHWRRKRCVPLYTPVPGHGHGHWFGGMAWFEFFFYWTEESGDYLVLLGPYFYHVISPIKSKYSIHWNTLFSKAHIHVPDISPTTKTHKSLLPKDLKKKKKLIILPCREKCFSNMNSWDFPCSKLVVVLIRTQT